MLFTITDIFFNCSIFWQPQHSCSVEMWYLRNNIATLNPNLNSVSLKGFNCLTLSFQFHPQKHETKPSHAGMQTAGRVWVVTGWLILFILPHSPDSQRQQHRRSPFYVAHACGQQKHTFTQIYISIVPFIHRNKLRLTRLLPLPPPLIPWIAKPTSGEGGGCKSAGVGVDGRERPKD